MNDDRPYARLCQQSYSAPPDYGHPGEARACRAILDGRLTVCFPGSRSLQDWLVDLLSTPAISWTEPRLGLVHAGFLLRAKNVLQLVSGDLRHQPYALCGHSLGGALALLVGCFMAEEGHPPVEVVTFGAPRVGQGLYQSATMAFSVRQYRYGADIVTQVPPYPFRHAREPIHLGPPDTTIIDNVGDHSIACYIGALELSHDPE